nr:hypothetical protein BHI3_01290 [Bacteriovorax sp. HI3]
MKLSKHINNSLFILIIVFGLLGAHYISSQSERPALFVRKQDSSVNIEENFFRFFHFGQKRLISSIIWIATILESDHDHYKGKDLNSWMFLRFNTISNLEPQFYENYAFGGPYLSIIKDDLKGASIIYNKGLEQYPEDFYLLKNAAFHFHFEIEDYQRSREIHQRLLHHKMTNPILYSSLARIESEMGNLEVAFAILLSNYKDLLEKNQKPLANKTWDNLYSIRAEIDLECLNKGLRKLCRLKDLNNEAYIKNSHNQYIAPKAWAPFRIKKYKHSPDQ